MSGTRYEAAVPILVSWLKRMRSDGVANDAVCQSIVRTLTVPWAAGANESLIELFLSLDDSKSHSLKWATGNAIGVTSQPDDLPQLLRLVEDRKHGASRQMIVLALGKSRGAPVEEVLFGLLSDQEVAGHAIMALGKIGSENAISKIQPFLDHERRWWRVEAKKALERIARNTRKHLQSRTIVR
ncbi:MAG: hypothetical protein WA668_12025 [Candidatus Cybelea sp.]